MIHCFNIVSYLISVPCPLAKKKLTDDLSRVNVPIVLNCRVTIKHIALNHSSLILNYYFLPLSGNTPVLRYSYTP